ncbi:MAG: virulence RhuM family protein [Bacilli bacterium]|nr:virulence RhuM family protein [Bacilli bacterium]
MKEKKYDLIAFTDKGLSLDVRVDPDEDTVWLTKDQMAMLFDRDRSVISRHISNIYKEKELNETATRAKNAQVQMEAGRAVTRISEFFNLDVIISVGYRVKSTRGVMFRKWASSVLKQYLIKGYAVDEKRLSAHEKSLAELSGKVLSLDARTHANEERVKALEEVAKRGGFPSESVFYSGEFLDARAFFAELFSKAEREIVIVDAYADSKLLSLLTNAKDGVPITLVKGPHSRLGQDDVDAFALQHGPLNVLDSDDFHDRFAFVDDGCYHVGASFNHMGKRAFAVMKMEDEATIRQLKERVDNL